MKKIFLSIFFSGAILFTHAQSSNTQEGITPQSSTANKKTKSKKNNKVNTAASDTLNNREIYKSKKTGQKATITGHQATGSGGSHANMPKNAARKKD